MTYFSYILYVYPRLTKFPPYTVLAGTFISWVVINIFVIALIIIYIYFSMIIKIYSRTKEIEKILPEYLQLVSANLKGGLSFERALWTAIRPEFGIIAKEITMISKKVMTGNDLVEALQEFTDKYESPLLRRSFDLIIGEVESGGQIAYIVDKVIENTRKTKALKEEMSAQTLSYMIFIGAIVVVIAPGLFALSYYLLMIMDGFSAKLADVNMPGMPLSISAHTINVGDFRIFSVLALLVISFFSALLISIIEKGDVKGGIKYIPMFCLSSITLYFVFMFVLSLVFGKLQF
jgi:hypothetical protein